MFAASRRRPLVLIALFAWLAQLCLPSAHAAVMARQQAGIAAWCGERSPALAAQLAALPDELRRILDPAAAHADGAPIDCLQFCGIGGVAAVPPPVPVALPGTAAALSAAALAPRAAETGPRPRPPARGPPTRR